MACCTRIMATLILMIIFIAYIIVNTSLHRQYNVANYELQYFIEPDNTNYVNITMISFLGVEGSGHHLFQSIFRQMSKAETPNSSVHIVYAVDDRIHPKYMFLHGVWWPSCCQILNITEMLQVLNFTDTFYSKADNSHTRLIFITSPQASYPCGNGGQNPYYPRLVSLVEDVNSRNIRLNDTTLQINIDLRLIVLKRHFIKTITSSCIHRFGSCELRVFQHYNGFMSIDTLTKSIKQHYFIVIDYHDLCHRSSLYAHILSKWLNIDNIALMKYGLSVIDPFKANASRTVELQNAWHEIERWDRGEYIEPTHKNEWAKYTKTDLNFSLKTTTQSLFSSTNLNHTIWMDNCVLVTPENNRFLAYNYTCSY
eukprot:84344_1